MSAPAVRTPAAPEPDADGHPAAAPPTRPHYSIVVAFVGVVLTAVLVVTTWTVHSHNEQRLLEQRTREAAAVLTAALPSIQTPLATAAELVEATDGADPAAFATLMQPYLDSGRPYVSASIWRVDGGELTPLMSIGEPPLLASRPPDQIRAFIDHAAAADKLSVIGLLDSGDGRLGYAYRSSGTPVRYVAYAEAALPPNRTSVMPRGNAFVGLANAIYLGAVQDPAKLLSASTPHLPLPSPRASAVVPFGDASLLLVMHPTGELGGTLMALLPWVLGAAGLLATAGAALVAERLSRRGARAEALAADNARLYAGQRSVAQALQHSLLPAHLPDVAGLDIAVRYVSGDEATEVGGDWYDAVELDDRRLLFVVGDVSGRGVHAASVMASLRYGIRAFASLGLEPATILARLGALLDVERDGHFATVVCVLVDLDSGTAEVANAGHPEPLLIRGGRAAFVDAPVGVPIGVGEGNEYTSQTMTIAGDTTLLLYTDGLFERRGETVDVGLDRLRRAATAATGELDGVLTSILDRQRSEGTPDDTALMGLRWHTSRLTQHLTTTSASSSS